MLEIMPELGSKFDKQFCEYLALSNPDFNWDDNNYISADLTVPSNIEVLDSFADVYNGNNGILTNKLITNNAHTIKDLNTNFDYIDMSSNKLKNILNSFNNGCGDVIDFPDSLEIIRGSFKRGYNIEHLRFGNNIKIIEDSFYRCDVKNVQFPDKPILLNGVGFLDKDLNKGSITNNNIELYEKYFYVLKGTHILIGYVDQDIINIPEGITSIGECCFLNCSATQINIPDTVVAIGNRAFCNCKNLLEITIPESVTMIGCNVFVGCGKLNQININYNNLEYIGKSNTWGEYASIAYLDANNGILNTYLGYTKPIINTYIDNVIPDHKYEGEYFSEFLVTNNITKIGKYAFANNSNLKSFSIAANVYDYNLNQNNYYISNLEYIDDYAFYNTGLGIPIWRPNYTKLKLKYIGKYAFAECSRLGYNGYSIPYSVTEIDDYAFYNSGSSYNSNIYFSKGPNNEPSQLQRIGKYAFAMNYSYNAKATEITIPASVTEIDDYAFNNQSKIKTITFEEGSNLKRIGRYAFEGCTSLTSIIIPEGVTEIGGCAFRGCTSLVNVSLPSTLIKIGYKSFGNCYRLNAFELPASVTNIIDGYGNAYYDYDYCIGSNLTIPENSNLTQTEYHMFNNKENVIIPTNITKIEPYTFYTCKNSVKTITIPEGVTKICHDAFSGCTKITNINIPDSVTEIGDNAFENCTSLTSINIPEGVTEIGDCAFRGCTSLVNVSLPSTFTSIGDDTFSGCTSLTSIVIPEGVTSIGESVFNGCTSLNNITLPNTLTSIGNYTFQSCNSLANIILPGSINSIGLYNTSFKNVIISEGTTEIRGIQSGLLESITLPSTITDINYGGFSNCRSLTSINIPEGVTSIEPYTFVNCISLESITLPNTLTIIGERAFENCTALTNIIIPEGVTYIGDYAFHGCASLVNVTLPSTLTSIGVNIFSGCKSLINIIDTIINKCEILKLTGTGITDISRFISSDMVNIPDFAFGDCDNLIDVIIPENISLIQHNAFEACDNIETISFLNENICIGEYAFNNCQSLNTLTFKNNNCKYIKDFGFSNCSALEVLNMPSYIFIGNNVFSGCSNLKEINFSHNITSLDANNTFAECTSLKKIIIPSNLKYIRDGTFDGCTNLKYAYVCDDHEYINFYSTGANTIKRICKYIDNQPYKLSLWNIRYLHQFSLSSYPNNPMIWTKDFSDKVYLDQENAQLVELETEYPVTLNSNTLFVSFKFVPVESGNYYITATDMTQQYNGAPGYCFYLYDFTAETAIGIYYMGDGDKFYTELISNHEYYFSIYRYTADTCNVHIHKYNGDFIKYASCGSNINNSDNLSLDELKEIKLYINYNSTDYEITMNEYIPRDENDTCNYVSYYGNLSKNPYATNVYNCTENVNDFPFFIYIDNNKNISISIDPFEDETMYLGGANQYSIPIEILTDIPEEIWDENEESSNG